MIATETVCPLCAAPQGESPHILIDRWPVCTTCYTAVARHFKAIHIDAVDGARLAAAALDIYARHVDVNLAIEKDREQLAEAVAKTVRAIAYALGRPE
jgi:hypothetical protein